MSFSKWEKLSASRIGNTVWEAGTAAAAVSAEEFWSKLFIGIQKSPRLPVYRSRGLKKNDKGIDYQPNCGQKPNKILFAMDHRSRRLGAGENGNVCNRNTVRCINGVKDRVGDVTGL